MGNTGLYLVQHCPEHPGIRITEGPLYFDLSKVNVKFTLARTMKAQRGSGVQLYSFFNLGARWVWVVNATPRPLYPGNGPVPIVQEAGWAPGPVWTGAENLASTGIRSPD